MTTNRLSGKVHTLLKRTKNLCDIVCDREKKNVILTHELEYEQILFDFALSA